MSRVVTHSETFSGAPTSYDTGYSAYDVSNVTSGYNPATNTTASRRAVIYLTRGSRAATNFPYIFDCSSIPSNANITSVSCSARTIISSTNANRVATRQVQMYASTTAKGSASNVGTSSGTPLTLTCGT